MVKLFSDEFKEKARRFKERKTIEVKGAKALHQLVDDDAKSSKKKVHPAEEIKKDEENVNPSTDENVEETTEEVEENTDEDVSAEEKVESIIEKYDRKLFVKLDEEVEKIANACYTIQNTILPSVDAEALREYLFINNSETLEGIFEVFDSIFTMTEEDNEEPSNDSEN